MTTKTTPIAETNHFIILDKYIPIEQASTYQTEDELENEFISDLIKQGYEYQKDIKTPKNLLDNVRQQLQRLNQVIFSDNEWQRFCVEYLDNPSDGMIEKSRKIHNDFVHGFIFDDGRMQNIYLLDKKNIINNHLQVINQFSQTGKYKSRYDVTILVNGLPLVQIELKKRGTAIREAFNQVQRYIKESFNGEHSLFKYLQIFVVSNGTDSRYFANNNKSNKNSFDFTIHWAKLDNTPIKDLKDFTATFFQKNTLLRLLLEYSVFDISNTLLLMRPYQIAATERILWKIRSSFLNKNWSNTESGGYIWHTTGSGKTLTSFKAARLATEIDLIDKVFFVVDRKDLDHQTMKEYKRFNPDSVNGSNSTAKLKENTDSNDNKIIVTTIQKLNRLIKKEKQLSVYQKNVVFIFDECHRSQFGEAQKNIQKTFKKFCQFGFTGTPIFAENSLDGQTTADIFGRQLHAYVITDAIRDEKVLKFKVDYNDVRPKFKNIENEQDLQKLTAYESKQAFLHPQRIQEISDYILQNFNQKTHRNHIAQKGFNAMFAVSSVDAAKSYYQTFKQLQKDKQNPLKIATIFSFAANEEQNAIGDIVDETFETTALNSTAKEFLQSVVDDYNAQFKTTHSLDAQGFENYYKDISQRVKNQEIDLLIVVGMFLTGFDAPTLNTLFVDKNLRYHGLIQAYSRTNRIFDKTKTFGNIITFRNLEQETIRAITLFGRENTREIILEKSYQEYLLGYKNDLGETQKGYIAIVQELQEKFSSPDAISKESDKKEFAKLFGEYLKVENILQNYDEFTALKAYQYIDKYDPIAIQHFQADFHLSDDDLIQIQNTPVLSERAIQDHRSTYHDIREWLRREKANHQQEKLSLDWRDVVFEVELLKSQEIDLDYILALIFEKNKHIKNKDELIKDISRMVKASLDNRAKEELIVSFIQNNDLNQYKEKSDIIEAFFTFAQGKQKEAFLKLVANYQLDTQKSNRYLISALKRGYISENGTELNDILPKISPLNPKYLSLKTEVFEMMTEFVEKFRGVGYQLTE